MNTKCTYCGDYLRPNYRRAGLEVHPPCQRSMDLDARMRAKRAARTEPVPTVEEMRVRLRESRRNRPAVFVI